MVHQLICHPDTPAAGVSSVEVELRSKQKYWLRLVYRVEPAATLLLAEHSTGPVDGLWKSTCFELFARSPGEAAYREFNFAPTFGWAAYDFCDRRAGMMPAVLDRPPNLVDARLDNRVPNLPDRYELDVMLDIAALPTLDCRIALSAVIEETDGTKSYWALRNPPGPPDFHHPDCFALRIPALG